jgi:hypothetical protein
MAVQPGLSQNIWGVFDVNGNLVVDVDTIASVDYSNESRVSSFPVEEGAFASYNKVTTPYSVHLEMVVGGDRLRLSNFLDKLEQLLNDTQNLYSVVTPERTYLNSTVKRFSYKRKASHGQDMIAALVELYEVRVVSPQYSSVAIALPPTKVKVVDVAMMSCHGKQQLQPPPTPDILHMSSAEIKALARKNARW